MRSVREVLELKAAAAAPCVCPAPVIDPNSGNVMSVHTCPACLPAGAITYLIENGRQLELFGEEGGNGSR